MTVPPRNLCVLFADVAGSPRLHERLGDAEALRAVERCLNRVDRVVASYKGRVIKTIGDDEIMAVFDSAEDGMQAACDMQQRVEDLPPVSGIKLAIRVGYDFGPAIEENDDVLGETVNVAARMTALAKGGQIIASGAAIDALPLPLRQSAREIDAIAVKGRAEAIRVCEVLRQDSEELAAKSAGRAAAAPPPRLRLRHGNVEITLDAAHPAATLGRDLGCDIVICDPLASRSHGRVELRHDKFMLVDRSTNGTYVTFRDEAEFVLKRGETPLRDRGRISFGHAWADDKREVLEFEVPG